MITLPNLFVPLLALLGAGVFVFGTWARARAGEARLAGRLAALEQRVSEQQQALERAEAARESAEADLRATEQRYLIALRGSQDGLWEWDIASGAVHLSPRWKGMLGFESHQLADDLAAWRGRVHEDDRAGFEQALAEHLAGQTPRLDHELRLLHADGRARVVLSRGVAIRDESGRAYRLVGLDTDVTALRRVQLVLDAVADGTDGTAGARFFAAMVQHFARALQVDSAFITECADDPPTRVRTLAYWSAAGGSGANFEYELAGTPCEAVIRGARDCFHPEGLERLFPIEQGFEAYLGLPIVGSDGRVLGHLAFLDRRARDEEMLVDRVFRIFLSRAAAEIERLRLLARQSAPAAPAGATT